METWMFRPPVLVGERVVWLGSGSGLPQGGIVRWIGNIPEIGPDWTVGLELDRPLPFGGIDGTWGNRFLFTCEPKHGLLVPISKIIRETDLLKWPFNSLADSTTWHASQNDLQIRPQPPARHRTSGCAAEQPPQPPARKPVNRPRPAVRRRKRFQISAYQTLAVIPEPKEPDNEVNVDDKVKSCSEFEGNDCQEISTKNDKLEKLYSDICVSDNNICEEVCRPYYGSLKSLKSLKSVKSVNTFITCQSGDYSDYQWYDADDDDDEEDEDCYDVSDFQDCKSEVSEPILLNKKVTCDIYSVVIKQCIEKEYKETVSQGDNHGEAETERMTETKGHSPYGNEVKDSSDEEVTGNSLKHSSTSTPTGSASRREKGASGFFSFLRWFRRSKDENSDDEEANDKVDEGVFLPPTPSSIRLIRTQSSSCGSIDTLFSTATVNSFAFISPASYRPYGSANAPEKWISPGPDTDTYRDRLSQRDKLRELDRNISLRKKYSLFGSDIQLRSGLNSPEASPLLGLRNSRTSLNKIESKAQVQANLPTSSPESLNSTFGRKKRKAPVPPDLPRPQYNDYSLPNTWEHKGKGKNQNLENNEEVNTKKPRHRRSASESSKDKKAGAYCHVKGKRKAPPPPNQANSAPGSTLEKLRSQFPSFSRKKRPAPPPPVTKPKEEEATKRKKDQETQAGSQTDELPKSSIGQLSSEEKDRLIANIAKLRNHANRRSMGSPPSSPKGIHSDFKSPQENVVCNDSLKLERGVLKPIKDLPKVETNAMDVKPAPVSPRPWYKRSLSSKDTTVGGIKKEIFKSLEKKRDKEKVEDWMPEVGIPRVGTTSIPSDGNSTSSTSSRFNIFARLDKSEEKKKEGEKRKSQVSMLANISELDREAAEIVQKEQAREQAMLAAQDAQFYSYPDMPRSNRCSGDIQGSEKESENVEVPKRSSAKELISLFNAIGNVTKVTVNSTFFSKEGSNIFSREGIEKRFSFVSEGVRTSEEKVVISESTCIQEVTQKRQSIVIDSEKSVVKSPSAQKRNLPSTNGETSGITIEEIQDDEDRVSKSRALYEANRSRRHVSPSPNIPTITEQSENTTPASTIGPGSKRDSMIDEVHCTVPATPDALQQAKKVTIWVCPRCTLENPRWKLTCDACGRWRPSVPDTKVVEVIQDDSAISSVPKDDVPTKKDDTKSVKNNNPIDWETELQKYFPAGSKNKASETHEKTKSITTDKNIEIPKQPAIAPLKTVTTVQTKGKLVSSTSVKESKTKDEINDNKSSLLIPSTFIGGRTAKDEQKSKIATNSTQKEEDGGKEEEEEPDVDEVRKARLAFFNRSGGMSEDPAASQVTPKPVKRTNKIAENKKPSLKPEVVYSGGLKLPTDDNEKLKLKEMLKEMKNSLPKHPKNSPRLNTDTAVEENMVNATLQNVNGEKNSSENDSTKNEGHKQGAIKKVPRETETKQFIVNHSTPENDTQANQKLLNGVKESAEAIFITRKIIQEETKVRKTAVGTARPMKVSTSSQTSSVVKKLEEKRNSHALPLTVEELSVKAKPPGSPQRMGSRTYELIRARDFATIEATKTGSDTVPPHVYANLPPSPAHSPSPQQQKQKDQPVLTPQQHSPISLQSTSSSEAPGREVLLQRKEEKINKLGNDKPSSVTDSSVITSGTTSPSKVEVCRSSSEASSYSMVSAVSSENSEVERLTAQLTLPKGLADFKADLEAAPPENNMNTLAVNRLLRRLEAAIAGGQHHQAACLAKDLARLKISCSVTRQRRSLDSSPASITVDMYVEDKVSHQGPMPLQVTPVMTVAELKQKVEQEFEIPIGVQRWILGKLLASDDSKTLGDYNVNTNGCPMFLYLVGPDGELDSEPQTSPEAAKQPDPEPTPALPEASVAQKGGWYYNHEEDRYSFCEETESEMADDDDDEEDDNDLDIHVNQITPVPEKEPVRIPQLPAARRIMEGDEEEEEEEEEEESEEEVEEKILVSASAVIIHERPIVVDPTPNVAISSAAQPEEQHLKTGTMKLGWKCPVCTLVNSPTRPGCAACTTERPIRYVVPVEYRANEQELERMKREQQHDDELQQAGGDGRTDGGDNQHYMQLVNLDNAELVPNVEPFDCSVCLTPYNAGEGIVLRECLHTFCRPCLVNTVQFNEEAEVKCPYRDADYACDSTLQEREIKSLVPPNVYEQHLAKSVAQAENKIGNAFHCKTPDCRGWCIFEDNVNEFQCPVCRVINCLTCQAIHEGVNCKQYQEQVQQQSETNAEARRTKEMLEEMVVRGEAMACPTCQVVLMKKWGCDWLRCSMCKTEICWVTRGPRWGPGGKGDTTGGCQCGVNGIKCHPKCNYCH